MEEVGGLAGATAAAAWVGRLAEGAAVPPTATSAAAAAAAAVASTSIGDVHDAAQLGDCGTRTRVDAWGGVGVVVSNSHEVEGEAATAEDTVGSAGGEGRQLPGWMKPIPRQMVAGTAAAAARLAERRLRTGARRTGVTVGNAGSVVGAGRVRLPGR